jgi:hypothetical protein
LQARNPLQQKTIKKEPDDGPASGILTVNGTKRQSQGHVPRLDDTRASAQFRTEFWTERLQVLKRHIESAQTSSSESAPSGGPDAEDGR